MLTYDECKNLLQPWEKRVDVSFDLFQAIGPWISCLWPLRTTPSFSARWVPQRTVVWSPSGQDMPLSLSSYHLPHPGSSTRPANQRGHHTPAWKAPASHYTRPSRGAWSNSSASPGEANRRQRSVPVLGHCFRICSVNAVAVCQLSYWFESNESCFSNQWLIIPFLAGMNGNSFEMGGR